MRKPGNYQPTNQPTHLNPTKFQPLHTWYPMLLCLRLQCHRISWKTIYLELQATTTPHYKQPTQHNPYGSIYGTISLHVHCIYHRFRSSMMGKYTSYTISLNRRIWASHFPPSQPPQPSAFGSPSPSWVCDRWTRLWHGLVGKAPRGNRLETSDGFHFGSVVGRVRENGCTSVFCGEND